MGSLAVVAIGNDRPGILRGHFAMMLIVGSDRPAAEVEAALASVAEQLDLTVSVRSVAPDPAPSVPGAHYVVTVHGADRPGIVAGISRVIAAHGGNVTDLGTRLTGRLYALTAEVDLPSEAAVDMLRPALAATAAELGVVAGIRPADADVL
jgi:glycine cleavage system transcriptional repressor